MGSNRQAWPASRPPGRRSPRRRSAHRPRTGHRTNAIVRRDCRCSRLWAEASRRAWEQTAASRPDANNIGRRAPSPAVQSLPLSSRDRRETPKPADLDNCWSDRFVIGSVVCRTVDRSDRRCPAPRTGLACSAMSLLSFRSSSSSTAGVAGLDAGAYVTDGTRLFRVVRASIRFVARPRWCSRIA